LLHEAHACLPALLPGRWASAVPGRPAALAVARAESPACAHHEPSAGGGMGGGVRYALRDGAAERPAECASPRRHGRLRAPSGRCRRRRGAAAGDGSRSAFLPLASGGRRNDGGAAPLPTGRLASIAGPFAARVERPPHVEYLARVPAII